MSSRTPCARGPPGRRNDSPENEPAPVAAGADPTTSERTPMKTKCNCDPDARYQRTRMILQYLAFLLGILIHLGGEVIQNMI